MKVLICLKKKNHTDPTLLNGSVYVQMQHVTTVDLRRIAFVGINERKPSFLVTTKP